MSAAPKSRVAEMRTTSDSRRSQDFFTAPAGHAVGSRSSSSAAFSFAAAAAFGCGFAAACERNSDRAPKSGEQGIQAFFERMFLKCGLRCSYWSPEIPCNQNSQAMCYAAVNVFPEEQSETKKTGI